MSHGLALPLGMAAALVAGPAQPQQAPAAWVAYAQALGRRIEARLARADDPVAARLHAFLDTRASANPDTKATPVVTRVWVGRDGAITRVTFATLRDPRADADLRAILLDIGPGPSPPEDLVLPIKLRLSLTVAG